MDDLSSTASEVDGHFVLSISGEVDAYAAARLRELLIDAHRQGCERIVVDLTEVTFIDSTGLGLLVGSLKRARAVGGDVKIVAVSDRVLKVFQLTGLERVFVICASVCEAVRGETG